MSADPSRFSRRLCRSSRTCQPTPQAVIVPRVPSFLSPFSVSITTLDPRWSCSTSEGDPSDHGRAESAFDDALGSVDQLDGPALVSNQERPCVDIPCEGAYVSPRDLFAALAIPHSLQRQSHPSSVPDKGEVRGMSLLNATMRQSASSTSLSVWVDIR